MCLACRQSMLRAGRLCMLLNIHIATTPACRVLQAEWAQYERVAERLADELADILQQRQPAAYVPPTTYHVAASTRARAAHPDRSGAAAGPSGGSANTAAGSTGLLPQPQEAGTPLDVLAAAVSVGSKAQGAAEGALQPLDAIIGRLLAQPLATRCVSTSGWRMNTQASGTTIMPVCIGSRWHASHVARLG